MDEIDKILNAMSNDVYQTLLTAVELGKWQNGTVLSKEQRDSTLQLIMLYQAKRLDSDEHMSIAASGKINELSKAELKHRFSDNFISKIILSDN